MKAKKNNDESPIQPAGPQPWRTSDARKALERSLLNPSLNLRNMTAREIYQSDNTYQCYQWSNFSVNLRRLCGSHGIKLPNPPHPRAKPKKNNDESPIQPAGPQPWRTSDARKALERSLLNPSLNLRNMTAREIYQSDNTYQCYQWSNFSVNLRRLCGSHGIKLLEERRATKSKRTSK